MDFLLNTENIRNICILAHVDHGKTTMADSLIASNGIISQKLAGTMRYMDSRQEEQERGITMKSSSIALKYINDDEEKYLINLVDTPGHVDFCGEVSAAVRLCDGALIVLDVVEGVCPQTKAALEQAWKEGIEPILVLNKIDRLILEQRLDETAAYLRLNQLLEQVNAIVASLLTTEIFEDDDLTNKVQRTATNSDSVTTVDKGGPTVYDWASAIEDIDDDKYYFLPMKNNVIFASSLDDWGFTIEAFAKVISEKFKINLGALKKTLWGDNYIDWRQKRILPNAQAKAKKSLFTSMVLESIWKVYDTVAIRRDKDKMKKICDSLGIELNQRDFNHNDARYQTKLIMSKWLGLSKHTLDCVTKVVPSPKNLSEKRVERLLSTNLRKFQQLPVKTKLLKQAFLNCSCADEDIKVACISKMIPVRRENLPTNRPPTSKISETVNGQIRNTTPNLSRDIKHESNEEQLTKLTQERDTVFIAFARIFSGKLCRGDKLYVLGPRHDPSRIPSNIKGAIVDSDRLHSLRLDGHITIAEVNNFCLLMGRDFEPIEYATAGNIVGILGLDKHLLRTATLSNDIFCPPFNDLHVPAAPILRVAVEPKNPLDTHALMSGLRLLNQADPCVEVKLQHTGEHVIVATGEVHLQHCVRDLKERYTDNIELNISAPIVPFRETIVVPPKIDMVNETIDDNNTPSVGQKHTEKARIVDMMTPNKLCRIRLKACPLPETILQLFLQSQDELKLLAKLVTVHHKSNPQSSMILSDFECRKLESFREKLAEAFSEALCEQSEWQNFYSNDFVDKIWSFGPKYSGPNLLVSDNKKHSNYSLWTKLFGNKLGIVRKDEEHILHDYVDSFISGFQLATQSGPLCEEPMSGVCFTIVEWTLSDIDIAQNDFTVSPSPRELDLISEQDDESNSMVSESTSAQKDNYGPLSGQIISTVKDCCRRAFCLQPQRLMSPMFSCRIQVTTEVLGKMYAVLGRRHGRIVHGDMREGSQIFEIEAFIPVIESLDFVNEIRKQTSGLANPQLIFSHYELIDIDPFWTPTTEEEYALYGEKADTENRARKYMNLVRKRKGLPIQEKIVEHGEKQRTIKRNK